jgi:hypothetical protein
MILHFLWIQSDSRRFLDPAGTTPQRVAGKKFRVYAKSNDLRFWQKFTPKSSEVPQHSRQSCGCLTDSRFTIPKFRISVLRFPLNEVQVPPSFTVSAMPISRKRSFTPSFTVSAMPISRKRSFTPRCSISAKVHDFTAKVTDFGKSSTKKFQFNRVCDICKFLRPKVSTSLLIESACDICTKSAKVQQSCKVARSHKSRKSSTKLPKSAESNPPTLRSCEFQISAKFYDCRKLRFRIYGFHEQFPGYYKRFTIEPRKFPISAVGCLHLPKSKYRQVPNEQLPQIDSDSGSEVPVFAFQFYDFGKSTFLRLPQRLSRFQSPSPNPSSFQNPSCSCSGCLCGCAVARVPLC